jgi:hypothetical protein
MIEIGGSVTVTIISPDRELKSPYKSHINPLKSMVRSLEAATIGALVLKPPQT